jgi:MFS family permease
MDEFSYLSVLLSIILGLAITQILKGFRGLLQSRKRVRLYWPALAWAGLLLVIYVQTWWAMFGLRSHHDWTFGAFAIVLLQTIVLYMLAGLVLPDFFDKEAIDLRENYYSHHAWFFGLAVLAGLVSIGKDLVLDGHLTDSRNLAFHLVFILTSTIAAITRREWYHKIAVLLTAALFGLYITLLFARLQ